VGRRRLEATLKARRLPILPQAIFRSLLLTFLVHRGISDNVSLDMKFVLHFLLQICSKHFFSLTDIGKVVREAISRTAQEDIHQPNKVTGI
jgi:hypothetical protein